jgi:hypothetical protein
MVVQYKTKSYYHPVKISGCFAVLAEVLRWHSFSEIVLFPDLTAVTNALSFRVKILAGGFACLAVYSWNVLGIWNSYSGHVPHCLF